MTGVYAFHLILFTVAVFCGVIIFLEWQVS